VILATPEAEIWSMAVQGQPGQIVHKTHPHIFKTTKAKWTEGVILQVGNTEFKPQSHQKKKKKK
jgi:hypothetical protein